MKPDDHRVDEARTAKDLHGEPAERGQKQPWQAPELLEANYDITSGGVEKGTDSIFKS
jgi:hypothetical protein